METRYIAVVGCSYTHWLDGDCELKNYPAFIARKYPEYTVVDLSVSGSGNSSAYFRIRSFERYYNIKFDKIIFQVTHYCRFLHIPKYDITYNAIFKNYQTHKNLIYTNGEYSDPGWHDITSGIADKRKPGGSWHNWTLKSLVTKYRLKSSIILKVLLYFFESDNPVLIAEKEIKLINGLYGEENVLVFSWHNGINHNGNLDIIELPKNWQGSINEMFGNDLFWKLGVDNGPHYDAEGHRLVFQKLRPSLDKLLR